MRLIKRVNKDRSIYNLYGDIKQHIEGTKGIDLWEEFNGIGEYDKTELVENYRKSWAEIARLFFWGSKNYCTSA